MKINILTIFPEMFSPLRESMTGRAIDNGIIELNVVDIRDYTTDKHNRVDDTPYGGGAGMVMQAQPIMEAYRQSGFGGGVRRSVKWDIVYRIFAKNDFCRRRTFYSTTIFNNS
jgi:tRNA (guanine37-N1)-methyltransferase